MSAAPPDRLLIVLLGAIGDVVCALPLAQRLRAGWPQTRVVWAVEPAAAPLLARHPAVHDVVVFRRDRGVRAFAEFLRDVRARRCEVALDLQRHAKSGATSLLSGARRRVGFHWRNSREGNRLFNTESIAPVDPFTHKLTHFQRFADHLGVPPAPVRFGLAPSAEEAARAATLLAPLGERPVAAVYVGTTWPSKHWMPGPTAAVCAGLRARGLGVALIGGPRDTRFAAAVVAAGAGELVDLVGRTGLRDVIAVMARAALAVGPDSGPMHIAAALGTPVVALFGPTTPLRTGPWGYEALVVQGDAPCAPCYQTRCPIGRLCMEAITPEQVLARVDRALAGGGGAHGAA